MPPPKSEPPKVDVPKVDVPKTTPPEAPIPEPQIAPMVSAALGDSSLAVGFTPAMFGDLTRNGVLILNRVPPFNNVPGAPPVNNNRGNSGGNGGNIPPVRPPVRVITQFPLISYAAFKISENESPRPTDRIFATYSYYNNLPTSDITPSFNVHRETVGFEKTFLDGRASVGVRVPFLQLDGPSDVFNLFGVRDGQFGDVSVITKYAFYDDRQTGNLISAGLMITAPTGQSLYTLNGDRIHPTLLQPWAGTIWTLSEDWFVQGFTSVVVPTDDTIPTAWYNDIALGYWLRRGQYDRIFHGIVPTFEAHIGTPLNDGYQGQIDRVYLPDYVSLVGGVNFVFGRNSTLGFAAGAPVTGPRPWDFESHVTFNFRF